MRRAGLPVAYSQGFSPHAKLHFGLALSTGYEGLAEYFDVDLDEDRSGCGSGSTTWPIVWTPVCRSGLTPTAARALEPGTPSLQDAVTSTTWQFHLHAADADEVRGPRQRSCCAADQLPIELVRKGKQVREDLRPLLLDLVAERTARRPCSPRSWGPSLAASDPPSSWPSCGWMTEPLRVVRTHQWITSDGDRREPIELSAPSPHAQARAS